MRTVIRTIWVRQTNIILCESEARYLRDALHQSRSKEAEFVHRIKSDIATSKENSYE